MCELAVNEASNWLMVDPWEALQSEYMPTAQVLDHFQHEICKVLPGVKIILLAGADLIQTMSTPGVWSRDDLDHILGGYGAFIVERSGTDIDDALASLQKWKDKVFVRINTLQPSVVHGRTPNPEMPSWKPLSPPTN
jgi:nicotinamide mononucleotide adenylyltransferase